MKFSPKRRRGWELFFPRKPSADQTLRSAIGPVVALSESEDKDENKDGERKEQEEMEENAVEEALDDRREEEGEEEEQGWGGSEVEQGLMKGRAKSAVELLGFYRQVVWR